MVGKGEGVTSGLIQRNHKKYKETIHPPRPKERDGDEGQCKGLGSMDHL